MTRYDQLRQNTARWWNALPQLEGQGLHDGPKGREITLTPAHRRWRDRINKTLLLSGTMPERLNEVRNELFEHALTLTSMLKALYGTPALGDHADPLKELLYLTYVRDGKISRSEPAPHYDGQIFNVCDLLSISEDARLSQSERERLIKQLNHIEQIHSLEFFATRLQALSDTDLLTTLLDIPDLAISDALRLMLYSFGRDTFPLTPDSLRVLERTGLLEPTGVEFDGLSFDQAQAAVQDLIAPSLRGILHVNSHVHGQQICLPERPECHRCQVKLLCKTGRTFLREQADQRTHLSLVDMFCGAGGLSDGFRQAGFRTVMAVDADPHAMRTYRLNHPEVETEAMLCRDIRGFREEAEQIRQLIGEREIDVLVGGPPCQGFSRAGFRSRPIHKEKVSQDERNHLYKELVDLLEVLRPRAVVLENVPGMGEVAYVDGPTDNRSFVQAARAAMEAAGYQTTTWLLNAADYGVAQERIRRIIVGVRDGPAPAQAPAATHNAPTLQHKVDAGGDKSMKPPALTLRMAIEDLPPLASAEGQNITAHEGRLLTGHVARFQNAGDLERYNALKPGENYRNLVARRPELKCYSDDHFPDKFYKLDPDRPSKTIVAHLTKDGNSFVHPSQPRSITPREAARLQSFADDYLFTGPLTRTFRQIGNAVPPLLAYAIADHLRAHLSDLGRLTAAD